MAPILKESEATVAACMISWLIQVDEDTWMPQWPVAAVTESGTPFHSDGRHFCNQVNGETRVHFFLLSFELDQPIVSLFKGLQEHD